jgi:hypothetical protein
MALDPTYLQYPQRRYGMDHDRYDWSMLADRAPVSWPNGAGVALWVNVALEFFPLNPHKFLSVFPADFSEFDWGQIFFL